MKLPAITKPCSQCPFKKDTLKGWLGKERMTEIVNSESFTCHKTSDEQGGRKQCAGFMLIQDGESQFEKLAKTLKQDLLLTGRELVFDTKEECIKHHSKE